MPIGNVTVYCFKVFVGYTDYFLSKKTKTSSEMRTLTKIYKKDLDCRMELIEIGISEHGTFFLILSKIE